MVRRLFLLLVLAQCAHSIEEYVTRLYEVFAPARFVSGLVGDNLAVGFAAFNIALLGFGLWCWAVPMHREWPSGRGLAWFWATLELANGTIHSALALSRGSYFPGAYTAPLLFSLAAWLIAILIRQSSRPDSERYRRSP